MAGAAIERGLDTREWQIRTPRAGSRDAVIVSFPHALDHALLERAVGIGPAGKPGIAGTITIDETQREWRFAPDERWRAGAYDLIALGILEDPSGNRIGQAFETMPASGPSDRDAEAEHRIPFEIR
jgi:hypothetical protein